MKHLIPRTLMLPFVSGIMMFVIGENISMHSGTLKEIPGTHTTELVWISELEYSD